MGFQSFSIDQYFVLIRSWYKLKSLDVGLILGSFVAVIIYNSYAHNQLSIQDLILGTHFDNRSPLSILMILNLKQNFSINNYFSRSVPPPSH